MRFPDIISAILAINPEAGVTVNAEDINQIIWHEGTTPIPNEQILAKQAELRVTWDALQYQRDRSLRTPEYSGYPSIEDQMDMMWHDKKDGTTTWEDAIQAIKDKYPKE